MITMRNKSSLIKKISNIIKAMPDTYSLLGNDYSRFVIHKRAQDVMKENWSSVGERLGNAIAKVDNATKETKPR